MGKSWGKDNLIPPRSFCGLVGWETAGKVACDIAYLGKMLTHAMLGCEGWFY